MSLIDVVASRRHYWRHLAPIVDELRARGHDVGAYGQRTSPWGGPWRRAHQPDLTVVAAEYDARMVRPRPVVYLEHGAGQTYTTAPGAPGWPGGRGLDHVGLFLCPGDHVAGAWRAAYPHAAVETVGIPALDDRLRANARNIANIGEERPQESGPPTTRQPLRDNDPTGKSLQESGRLDPARNRETSRTIAMTFHWDCVVAPEASPALPHYRVALPAAIEKLVTRNQYVLGHGHPRAFRRLERMWRDLDVEPVARWEDVIDRADILVADNTSALYEWALLDRPCVVLNAPWYRRDIDHGLRFWSHVPGVQVDDPAGLVDAITEAVSDPPHLVALRAAAAAHVYAHRDGTATARAADAIEEQLMRPARRVETNERQDRAGEIVTRFRELGATDDEVEAWADAHADTPLDDEELFALVAMSDGALIGELRAVRGEYLHDTLTEDEQAAAEDAARFMAEVALETDAAYAELGQSIDGVLGWVGDDRVRAGAVLEVEGRAEKPRKGLISAVERIVG